MGDTFRGERDVECLLLVRTLSYVLCSILWLYRLMLKLVIPVLDSNKIMPSLRGNAFCIKGPLYGVSNGHLCCVPLTKDYSCGALIFSVLLDHYSDVIMGTIASQITSLAIVYSTVYSDADQRKYQSSASLAFMWGNSPETGEFPAQMASNAENVSIWWRHHAK